MAAILPADHFWNSLAALRIKSEADVEQRLLLPLLTALNYAHEEVTAKAPLVFQTGRRGRRHEADFVVHHGAEFNLETSLIVVEAKAPEQDLEPARMQAESYAHASRAPVLLISDGLMFEIWQMQSSRQSSRALSCPVRELARYRGEIERLIGRGAAAAHCRALGYKPLEQAGYDVSAYVESELARTADHRSIPRRLRVEGRPQDAFDALGMAGRGAFVLGSSGYGKTTLAVDLHRHWLAISADGDPLSVLVPLPDLAELDQAPEDFARERLAARCPQFGTRDAFGDLLETRGARIICDGLDRISHQAQRRFLARAGTLLRDRPRVRLIVLGRTRVQSALGLPDFELLPLDRSEREALAALIDPLRGALALHRFPALLDPLLEQPLLLKLLLEFHATTERAPDRLDSLFEAWLGRLFAVDGHAPAMVARVRDLLTRFAVAVSGSARPRMEVMARVSPAADEPLDALVATGAIIIGERIELLHDALGDYLRAEALLELPASSFEAGLSNEPFTSGSLLAPLLMSRCEDPGRRELIWRRIEDAGLDVYVDTLRFGGDIDYTADRSDAEAAEAYLREFRDGIVAPAHRFMRPLEPELIATFTRTPGAGLGVLGELDSAAAWVSYGFFPAGHGPFVRVGQPPPQPGSGGFNLALHVGARNARMMGLDRLRVALASLILRRALEGGPHWANERLLGRLRYARRQSVFAVPLDIDLQSLDDLLAIHHDRQFELSAGRYWSVSDMRGRGEIAPLRPRCALPMVGILSSRRCRAEGTTERYGRAHRRILAPFPNGDGRAGRAQLPRTPVHAELLSGHAGALPGPDLRHPEFLRGDGPCLVPGRKLGRGGRGCHARAWRRSPL